MKRKLTFCMAVLSAALIAGPVAALELGASVGGGVSAGADSGGRSGGVSGGASASAGVSARDGGSLLGLGSLTDRLGGQGAADARATTAGTAAAAAAVNAAADGQLAAQSDFVGDIIGAAVISADGARVGTVVGVGIDARGEATSLQTNIGGFFGLGATPVRFTLDSAVMTAEQVRLRATQAELFASIQASGSAGTDNVAATASGSARASAGGAL